jgi:hypothetical protein
MDELDRLTVVDRKVESVPVYTARHSGALLDGVSWHVVGLVGLPSCALRPVLLLKAEALVRRVYDELVEHQVERAFRGVRGDGRGHAQLHDVLHLVGQPPKRFERHGLWSHLGKLVDRVDPLVQPRGEGDRGRKHASGIERLGTSEV